MAAELYESLVDELEEPAPELATMSREALLRVSRLKAELAPAIRAELKLRRVFGLDNPDGFHGDERTGDSVGDEDALARGEPGHGCRATSTRRCRHGSSQRALMPLTPVQ